MNHSDFGKLPITISTSDRIGCFRVLHMLIGAPLVLLSVWSLYWGDRSAIFVLVSVAAFSGICELIGYFLNRNTIQQHYAITLEGVQATEGQDSWFEPLSSYTGIEWREQDPVGEGMTDWRLDLCHESRSDRSICLLEPGRLTRNMDADLRTWTQLKEILQLGGDRKKVSSWDEPEQKITHRPQASSAPSLLVKNVAAGSEGVRARRSLWIWCILLPLLGGLAVSLVWRVTDGVIETFPSAEDGLILLAGVGLTLVAACSLTTITLRPEQKNLVLSTSLWGRKLSERTISNHRLSHVSPLFNGYGVATITFHLVDEAPVTRYMLRSSDVRRTVAFAERFCANDPLHDPDGPPAPHRNEV